MLTTNRLVAIQALLVSSQIHRLRDGRRSQMQCTQREAIYSANCGIQGVRRHLRSAADNNLSARVTSQWKAAGQMAQCVQSTHPVL